MADEKSEELLGAAFETFLRYGFKRTTMADLADAAGVSRPWLYTRYRNKEDLFRAVATREVSRALERALAALAGETAAAGKRAHLCDRLLAAYERWSGDFLELFDTSPHAREVLDTHQALAGEAVSGLAERFRAAVVEAIASAEAAGRVDLAKAGLTPASVMQVLTDVSNGSKYALADARAYRERLAAALQLIDAAVRRPRTKPWRLSAGR